MWSFSRDFAWRVEGIEKGEESFEGMEFEVGKIVGLLEFFQFGSLEN
jgi:hypothetical protein